MIIYRVSTNWRKSITKFEIESIVDNETFMYLREKGTINERLTKGTFLPKLSNSPSFFIEYEDAKKALSERLKTNISFYESQIKDAMSILNTL